MIEAEDAGVGLKVLQLANQHLAVGEFDRARLLLNQALQKRPRDVEVLRALGTLEFETGNYEVALEYLNQCLSLEPNAVPELARLALINLKLNRMEAFQAALNKAMKLDPACGEAIRKCLQSSDPTQPADRLARSSPAQAPHAVLERGPAFPPGQIPVVLLHLDHSPYVGTVIAQASQFNENVVLIGNEKSQLLVGEAAFEHLGSYTQEADYFRTIYRHLSPNAPWIELFCFQRWFILKSYMESNNLEVCFHIDSDVLLYANATEEYQRNFLNSEFDFTLVAGCCGSSSFFTRRGLTAFCDLVRSTYEHQEGLVFQELLSNLEFSVRHGRVGGICDMSLLRVYQQRAISSVGEMTQIRGDAAYDHNINVSDGYAMAGSIKDVQFLGGVPYVRHITSGRMIRFNCLHFQGPAKARLHSFTSDRATPSVRNLHLATIENELSSTKRKDI